MWLCQLGNCSLIAVKSLWSPLIPPIPLPLCPTATTTWFFLLPFLSVLLSLPPKLDAQTQEVQYSFHLGQNKVASPDLLLPVFSEPHLGDRPVNFIINDIRCYVLMYCPSEMCLYSAGGLQCLSLDRWRNMCALWQVCWCSGTWKQTTQNSSIYRSEAGYQSCPGTHYGWHRPFKGPVVNYALL